MLKFLVRLQQLATRSEDRGATAVEYGLLVALIAAVIIVAVTTLGSHLSSIFSDVNSKMSPAPAAS